MKMIDGHKLIMSLTDWWYSTFGLEETEKSKDNQKSTLKEKHQLRPRKVNL